MPFSLLPTVIVDSVTNLTPEELMNAGVDLLMLDFDNTIVPYTTDEPTPEMAAWLRRMQDSPVKLCVVSNSKHDRVKIFCARYGLDCITHARKPFPEMAAWLRRMQDSPVKLCVVSNSKHDRVKIFCARYGLDCITHARKPFSKGIRACMERFAIEPERCALAGDQIFTDTMGARCCGVRAILVRAIHNHTIWLKLRHVAELPFIFIARNRRNLT